MNILDFQILLRDCGIKWTDIQEDGHIIYVRVDEIPSDFIATTVRDQMPAIAAVIFMGNEFEIIDTAINEIEELTNGKIQSNINTGRD